MDVIDIADIAASTGKVEINQMLQYAAPSFNATKQSGSDGADHIDPASLRGLGPDQTLVLINGKRRHQSSLVNVFGTRGRGNTGTDLNALPASAIKRIEILRDGASAQYGSDAIAGVINIVLKDKTDGVTGGVTYGAYSTAIGANYEEEYGDALFNVDGKNFVLDPDGDASWDGQTVKVDLNYGVALWDKGGFAADFTTEYRPRRGHSGPVFVAKRLWHSSSRWFHFMVNSSMPLGENTELYAFGGRKFWDTDAFAFSPQHCRWRQP
ncbi:MAG: TonB-dependent receptor plug domain-containing protein [Saprospiraceae bacterium]